MSISRILSNLFEDKDRKIARSRYLLCYTGISAFILLSTHIAASYPCLYMKMSALVTLFLFIPRIILYCKKSWYLYLLDYSYAINIAMIYLMYNGSSELQNSILLAASYSLIINVFRYGSSLCVHTVELFTNCYFHINPAIALTSSYLGGCIKFNESLGDILYYSSELYFIYAAIYILLVYVLLKPVWKKKKIPNLFNYHHESESYKRFYSNLPSWLLVFVLWVMNFVVIMAGAIFAYYGMQHKDLLVFACFVFVPFTIYRAGTYYIDYIPATAVKMSKEPGS